MKLLSLIYQLLATGHRWLFDNGFLKTTKLSKPVFSVGNLSMGGSGKTPLTLFLYDQFVKKNKKPAIVCRSYKAQLKTSEVLPPQADPSIYGDEAVFYKSKRPEAVVISGPVKTVSAQIADQLKDIDIILVDDGFQHHSLFKNWNGVVFDLSVPYEPLGRMREPLKSLKYADTLFLSRSELSQNSDFENLIRTNAINSPVYKIESKLNLQTVDNKKYLLASAIGNPSQFYAQVRSNFNNCSFVEKTFADHHQFTQADIKDLEDYATSHLCSQIICTEKDFVKIRRFKFNDQFWTVATQEIQISPNSEWQSYFEKLFQEHFS